MVVKVWAVLEMAWINHKTKYAPSPVLLLVAVMVECHFLLLGYLISIAEKPLIG